MADNDISTRRRQPAPRPPICPKCVGSGKVFTFTLVDGRTREVWLKCSACSGLGAVTPGP